MSDDTQNNLMSSNFHYLYSYLKPIQNQNMKNHFQSKLSYVHVFIMCLLRQNYDKLICTYSIVITSESVDVFVK